MDMREQNTTAFAPLPWPHTADKATLRIVAAGSGNPARSASLARFLAAAFLFLALLLLLIGLAKQHEAALAGAGRCSPLARQASVMPLRHCLS